jgi:hypothetical protein
MNHAWHSAIIESRSHCEAYPMCHTPNNLKPKTHKNIGQMSVQNTESRVPGATIESLNHRNPKHGAQNWVITVDITRPPDTRTPEARNSNTIVKFHQVPNQQPEYAWGHEIGCEFGPLTARRPELWGQVCWNTYDGWWVCLQGESVGAGIPLMQVDTSPSCWRSGCRRHREYASSCQTEWRRAN